ncbi:MAG: LssY C-terminal domain-containing protein [Acidobacteria bacterium]|nr:LssY C-terminal domain-containing protein [Acidobacteriota bacterium]
MMKILLLCGLTAMAASGQKFQVPLKGEWLDTALDLAAGSTLKVTVTGDLPAAGTQKGFKDLLKTFPVNDAGRGALVARIGEAATARPFLIGESIERRVPVAGRLFLGANLPSGESLTGTFEVTVTVVKGAPKPPVNPSQLPKLTQRQLDSVPNRVVDAQGTEGDRVNFFIIGAEKKIVELLTSGGWVRVNRNKAEAAVGMVMSVLNRRGYVELPMSELIMFDRPQDYGFALGDPLKNISSRHHFRLWKAPFTAGGQEVWVGAGTHDIGFDKDQRNGKLTHRIDEDTDKEREFIGESLKASGEVATTYYLTHRDPVTKTKTAHGQEFFSDGRTLIVVLTPDAAAPPQ